MIQSFHKVNKSACIFTHLIDKNNERNTYKRPAKCRAGVEQETEQLDFVMDSIDFDTMLKMSGTEQKCRLEREGIYIRLARRQSAFN